MATTDNWIGKSSADWGTSAANWSTGFPTSNSNVDINTTNILTIGFGGGDNYVINSLAVGNDFFDISGGSLRILGNARFADSFTQTGGTLSAGGAVTISGTGTLTGGGAEGNTAFSISGTIFLANYTLGGSTVLNNVKTTNQTGQISLGDDTGIDATINNEKGAVFDIAGDYGITQGAGTARFVNAAGATLEKTGGSGTSLVDVNLTDTGAIVAATGTLEFGGPDNSFAGAISGAGQFALGGGSNNLIAAGAAIASATFGISDTGTLVTLGKNLSYTGTFNLENSSILDLAGFTLNLSGTDTFSDLPTIDGTGASMLVTKSGGTASVDFLTLGGTVDWQNSGTVGEVHTLTIGDATFNAATFTNEKGGVYEFTTDNGIARGAALNSSFINLAGAMLEKNGGNLFSLVDVNVTDTGAITAATGTLEFRGPNNSFAGAISGAGQFVLGLGSSDLIAFGATIGSATFGITDLGTVVTLGENLSYAGAFNLENSATLNVDGFTSTLSGTDMFSNSSTISGNGTLITTHGSTTGVNNFTLGGQVDWHNSGTVNDMGGEAIGDASYDVATFTNEKGGVYDFVTDNGIAIGAVSTSSFVNLAGATLEKTAGTEDSIISVDMTDTGAITVNTTGTIEFEGIDNSFAGAISGIGQFALGAGSTNLIASGATIATGTFGITDLGTVVTLGENLSYAHIFNLENSAVLRLDAFTLTLSGTDAFSNSSTIDGTGTLVTEHGGTASANGMTLGGAVDWQNSGTVDEIRLLTLGDASLNAATFTNEKAGVYNFTNDNGIALGAAPTSKLVNLAGGTLEKTGGTGDSAIAPAFTNNGAVTVTTGTIEFQNTVGGTGTFTLDAGAVLQFDSRVAGGSSVDFAGTSGGELSLLDSRQFGAAIHGFGGIGTDYMDLRDINFTSSSAFKLGYTGSTTQGVLTVTDGTNTARLTMFGKYTTANFHASADGFGGTAIVDPTAHSPLLAFAR
jgi:hypothetical protein